MLRVLCILAAVVLGALPAVADKRVALIIGNSAYQQAGTLANPVNDAKEMGAALQDLGFVVLLGLDLDKRAFDIKVRDFSRALADADTGVFFYAGHGLQIAGHNYLIPIDAQLQRERDVDFVGLDFILKQMELEREGKTNIVFLDACRDNPLARNLARSMGTRSASVGQGLAQVQTGVGTFIAYSTQPGNVALDGDGRNSPFTAALAKGVREPGRNLTAIMIDVRKDVLLATNGRQVPWDHSALTADFYFQVGSAADRQPGHAGAAQGARAPAGRSQPLRPAAHLRYLSQVRSGERARRAPGAQHGDRQHPAADGAPRPGAEGAARADRQARGRDGRGRRAAEVARSCFTG